jgi:hypothetical protein
MSDFSDVNDNMDNDAQNDNIANTSHHPSSMDLVDRTLQYRAGNALVPRNAGPTFPTINIDSTAAPWANVPQHVHYHAPSHQYNTQSNYNAVTHPRQQNQEVLASAQVTREDLSRLETQIEKFTEEKEKGDADTQNANEGWRQYYTSSKDQITKLNEEITQANQHTQYYRTLADNLKSQVDDSAAEKLKCDKKITRLKNKLETAETGWTYYHSAWSALNDQLATARAEVGELQKSCKYAIWQLGTEISTLRGTLEEAIQKDRNYAIW